MSQNNRPCAMWNLLKDHERSTSVNFPIPFVRHNQLHKCGMPFKLESSPRYSWQGLPDALSNYWRMCAFFVLSDHNHWQLPLVSESVFILESVKELSCSAVPLGDKIPKFLKSLCGAHKTLHYAQWLALPCNNEDKEDTFPHGVSLFFLQLGLFSKANFMIS